MIGERNTDDVRIKEVHVVLPPIAIREKYPLTPEAKETVMTAGNVIFWASLVMTVYSGAEYVWKNRSVFSM